MERGSFIQMTERELEAERRQAAREGARAVLERFDQLERRLQALHGFADKATLASIYETSQRTIERWDERHDFRRVDGPRRDRIYFDLDDVKAKVCKAEVAQARAREGNAQSESDREASSGPED